MITGGHALPVPSRHVDLRPLDVPMTSFWITGKITISTFVSSLSTATIHLVTTESFLHHATKSAHLSYVSPGCFTNNFWSVGRAAKKQQFIRMPVPAIGLMEHYIRPLRAAFQDRNHQPLLKPRPCLQHRCGRNRHRYREVGSDTLFPCLGMFSRRA